MSPEERATGVVQDYHAKRCWGYDPVQHAEYEQALAIAIREAVAAERERCATLVERFRGDETGYVWCDLNKLAARVRGLE